MKKKLILLGALLIALQATIASSQNKEDYLIMRETHMKQTWHKSRSIVETHKMLMGKAHRNAKRIRKELCTMGHMDKCEAPYVLKKGWESNYMQQYAYEISGYDKRFVMMLDVENGQWTHTRRHNPANNTVGVDWGLCGINDYFHPHIVNDPRFLKDWKWQMQQCYDLYRKGVTFYGLRRLHLHNLTFIEL